jgi:hypothetical protein
MIATVIDTQRASTLRLHSTRHQPRDQIGVATVDLIDDATGPNVVPMTSAPHRQVSSISHAQSMHSNQRPSEDFPQPGDEAYPDFTRWLDAKREREIQEQQTERARASQPIAGRLANHREHFDDDVRCHDQDCRSGPPPIPFDHREISSL